jgi:hypothetical protein
MIALQLPFVAEFFGRLRPLRGHDDAVGASARLRLLPAIARALRSPSPVTLNDHLRRDIGLEPVGKRQDVFWPW